MRWGKFNPHKSHTRFSNRKNAQKDSRMEAITNTMQCSCCKSSQFFWIPKRILGQTILPKKILAKVLTRKRLKSWISNSKQSFGCPYDQDPRAPRSPHPPPPNTHTHTHTHTLNTTHRYIHTCTMYMHAWNLFILKFQSSLKGLSSLLLHNNENRCQKEECSKWVNFW